MTFGALKGSNIRPLRFEANLNASQEGDRLRYDIEVQGEAFEREVYEISDDVWRLVQATDDTFVPGIDLIRFKNPGNRKWDWNGRLVYAGVSRSAQGAVTLSQEGERLRTDVELTIDTDGTPIKRSMQFWFEPKNGLVARRLGDVSRRGPKEFEWPR